MVLLFRHIMSKKRAGGKASLRRMQWKSAEDGNTTMLIWLGKNILGQTDKVQNEISGPNGAPVQINLIRSDFKQKSDE